MAATSINVNDIKPSSSDGDVVTVVNGKPTWRPQVSGKTSTSVLNISSKTTDVILTASGNLSVAAPTFSSLYYGDKNGAVIRFRIKSSGVSRAISWNSIYRPIGFPLPLSTVSDKLLYVGAIYNSTDDRWDVLAVNQES